jgi:hypothetical protein
VVTTTAVASAASFAGSRALRASFRPQQVVEAEAMAMELLVAGGWDGREVSDQLEDLRAALPDDAGLGRRTARIGAAHRQPDAGPGADAGKRRARTAASDHAELPPERLPPAIKPPF